MSRNVDAEAKKRRAERDRARWADPTYREQYYAQRIARNRAKGVKPAPTEAELEASFWAKTERVGECLEWTGMRLRGRKGFRYGIVTRNQQRIVAHRVAYEYARGPIPEGMFVCHHCDNPPCVRPEHLFVGTQEDNARDMAAKGRWRNQFAAGNGAT